MSEDALPNMDRTHALAEQLKRMSQVAKAAKRRGGSSVDGEAWQIATGLADIEESTNRVFGDLVPRLMKIEPGSTAADDLLHDLGEEYRHILYHILDTKIFDYIVPDEDDGSAR